jgi:hypothetical protein
MRTFFPALEAIFLVVILTSATSAGAANEAKPPEVKLAAAFQLPQIPGLSGPSVDWHQWDSFFTFVVKQFGQDLSGDLKDSLGEAFLDSRYELTSAVAPGQGGNPVPDLFLNAWNRLSPIMNKALPGLSQQTASRYATFISAADKLAVIGKQGSQLGLLQLSPDALRGLAGLLGPSGGSDPLAFNLDVDSALRNLLGFTAPLAAPNPAPGIRQSRLPLPSAAQASLLPSWLDGSVLASEPQLKKLNGWVPDPKEIQLYLTEVRGLLVDMSDKVAAKSKLAEEYKPIYRQIVFAAGWQESCWRQYIRKGKDVTPLASATGGTLA